jgi:uncharacterized protein (TIGR02145 family)
MKRVIFLLIIIHTFLSCKKLKFESQILEKKFEIGNGVIDIDGNEYKSVIINGSEWMAENLRVTRFNNGDSIIFTDNLADWLIINNNAYPIDPRYCYSKFDSTHHKEFGYLYNLRVASNAQNVCPNNWHIPSKSEWNNLHFYVSNYNLFGLYSRSKGSLNDGNGLWKMEYNKSTDTTSLSIQPAGSITKKMWRTTERHESAYFYSSTWETINYQKYPISGPIIFFLINESENMKSEHETDRIVGLSIRCVKDKN